MRKQIATFASVAAVIGLSAVTAPLNAQVPAGAGPVSKIPIKPGTALAALVKDSSQHMALLAAPQKGLRLKVDIPLWLRAHYRRNHTEMLTAARPNDPTGGFPLALESLYVWMLHHQDLQPSPAGPAAAPTRAVAVGKNLRISGPPTSPKSESDIRINFKNAKQIISASNNPGGSQQAQFFSPDGGATWGQTNLPLVAGDSLQSDPTVDWTSDGTAWATTIGIGAGNTVLQMRSYKSQDGGQTWTFDATFSGNQTSADKQMMWVDRSATSPFRDTIYAIWHNNAPGFVNRRTAAGWGAPVQVSGSETTGTAIGSDITTNSAGDVFAVWPDTGTRNLFVSKSTDGGASFGSPTPIAQTFGSFQIRVPSFAERGALIGVSIAAFRDTTRNDVYVCYTDLSGESGCDTPDSEPVDNVDSSCKSRIWFTRSTDGGVTWEAPRKVNAASGKSDQFNQKLAVDPASGLLGMIYYDTEKAPSRKQANLVFAASADNGAHWSTPPITVATKPTDETTSDADTGNQYGDYNGLTVANGVFFPSWTDRRDTNPEAIFTARITVTKDGAGNPVPTIAAAP
jgi:hypothetical protein